MLRSDADAPKPPAYPFIKLQFQRAICRQKTCDPPIPWRIPSRLVFRFSGVSLGFRRRSVPSPSRFRFGEAVFTEPRRNPQEGKMRSGENFRRNLKTPQNLGVGASLPTRRGRMAQVCCAKIAPDARSIADSGRDAALCCPPRQQPHAQKRHGKPGIDQNFTRPDL